MVIKKISAIAVGVEMHMERAPLSADTHIRGWKDGVYILVDAPDGRWKVKDPTPIVCRLFEEGKYYGFMAAMFATLPELNLLLIEYPDEIVDTSVREEERFKVSLPVTITAVIKESQVDFPGIVIDLSQNGCQLISSKPVNVNDRLLLAGGFPGGQIFKDIPFVTKRVDELKGKWQLGGALDINEGAGKEAFERFLSQLRVYLKG
ncbi:MAG: PilZ domain-containing protein [Nitrospinae bacterium]|nr:PilZ domain-containing protein [Nitrospinota bacterium]